MPQTNALTIQDARAQVQPEHLSRDIPLQTREAELVPATFNEADNTIEVVWTMGARRRSYDWENYQPIDEELVVSPEAVDMTRFEAGTVQVLDGHRVNAGVNSILGIATRGWISGGEGRATLRLSQRPELAGIVADIRAGVIRAISFGYSVQRYEITRAQDRMDGGNVALYRATRWTPQEISFVTVPADAQASTRDASSLSPSARSGLPCEFIRAIAPTPQESAMPKMADQSTGGSMAAHDEVETRAVGQTPASASPSQVSSVPDGGEAAHIQQRSADINELCVRHGLPQLATTLIREGATLQRAQAAVLDELARQDASAGGHRNVRIETVRDENETRMVGMAEALHSRLDAQTQLTDNSRQFRGMSLIELGRELIERSGANSRGLTRLEVANRMLQVRSGFGGQGNSDFGYLLSNIANKRLQAAYEQAESTYRTWARRAPNAPDFKDINVVQLSSAPELLKTNEHGEFTYGTLKDGGESYKVVTYGRIVTLTRQAIINDDLRGFDRLLTAFGDSARRLENRLVYAQLLDNPKLSDGKALFHADHGNLGSGADSALSLDSLGAARTGFRKQKGLQGEVLNITPRYLIAPTELEQLVYQLTSANYTPTTALAVNEFRAGGRTALEPVIEPLLTDAKTWYLAANSGQIDTVEYAYLDGAEGVVLETKDGFEVDGVQTRARLDFGAKVIDYRGLRKQAGA